MRRIFEASLAASLLAIAQFLAPAALAHGGGWGGGGGGGGGGHSGGGHSGGGYYSMPIFVGGGAPAVPDSDVGNYSAIHKVALLSAIGTSFSMPSGFSKAIQPDVTSWQVDELVAATLKKYLADRFTFTDATFDKHALIAINQQIYRERDTLKYLQTLPNQGVDAYIVVRPADAALPGPASLGLDVAPNVQMVLWANFEIDIIDAQKFSYIGKAFARTQTQQGQPPTFAAIPVTMGSVANLILGVNSPPALELLHRELSDLLPRALVETLRSLQLGVPLPPIGDHSIAEPASAAVMKGIHSVAVVSALGDSFELVNPGNMFVKQTEAETPYADARIDEQVEAIARSVLAHHYTVKDVAVDRGELARMTLIAGKQIPPMQGLKPSSDVDAFVLIVKASSDNGPYHGIGLRHVTPVFNHETSVFAQYAIVVVNARTLKGVTGSTGAEGSTVPCAKPEDFPAGIPECSVDESLWPASGNALTADGVTRTSSIAMQLLSNGIPETLYRLGLDEAAPGTASAISTGNAAGAH